MIGVIGERSEGRGIMVEASAIVRQLIATSFPVQKARSTADVISESKTHGHSRLEEGVEDHVQDMDRVCPCKE